MQNRRGALNVVGVRSYEGFDEARCTGGGIDIFVNAMSESFKDVRMVRDGPAEAGPTYQAKQIAGAGFSRPE
jgi:hypothetical protein